MSKFIFIILFLLIAENVYAWKTNTHQEFAENVYYSMPDELQSKLDLNKMKEGSIAPDKFFKDSKNHYYPMSLILAKKWLNNKSDLSYNFGIATNYISDSFDAPYSVIGKNTKDKNLFEGMVSNYKTNVQCEDYGLDLDKDLIKSANNKVDWIKWLGNRDKKIVEKEYDESMMFIYSAAIKEFNYTCRNKTLLNDEYFDENSLIKAGLIFLFGLPLLYFFKDGKEAT